MAGVVGGQPRTPPNKRHHLPFSMMSSSSSRRNNPSSTLVSSSSDNNNTSPRNSSRHQAGSGKKCGGWLNQIFLMTCVASFILQLFGSLMSWTTNYHYQQYYSNQQQQVGQVGVGGFSPIRRHLASIGPSGSSSVSNDQQQNAGDPTLLSHDNDNMNSLLPVNRRYGQPPPTRRLRVLFGILTADFFNDQAYRKRHRALFKLWNDSRVCSLPHFKSLPINERYGCEIVYTFVMGGGTPDVTPELVDDSRPILAMKPIQGKSPDLNDPDVTLLNIRENMNEGKSQTWLKHGAEIAEEYDLDYVVKCDADAMLHLHEFFHFAYEQLPPAPYNKHVYVGALRDKAYWPRHKTEEERIRYESYFGNNFEGVHLYVAGQIYMVSTDLAKYIGQEAHTSKCSYCEGHEDHDISAMAFHSPNPVKLVVIGRNQRFWEHPVKGEPRWKRIWARETARMAGEPFEGKMFSKNSTFDVVMKDKLPS